ncbi:MAG: hypothetical protein ABWX74_17510 [Aeromicrobium sp.]
MTAYRVALPHPWQRIPLDDSMGSTVDEIVEATVRRIPADVPPDQVAQTRIKLEGMLLKDLRHAKDNGGLDYYLPTDLVHGIQISASFLVSGLIPDASVPDGLTGRVLASLIASSDDAAPVDAGGSVWVRSTSVIESRPDDLVKDASRARKVEYTTAVPGDERRWIIVSFTTLGDGDPDSEFTGLMVELFDAIMSTWRWLEETS